MGFLKKCKEFVEYVVNGYRKIYLFFKSKINKETRRIVILGSQISGKTELWCRLQGIPNQENGGTSNEPIEWFELGRKEDGTPVFVLATRDIGGGDKWVYKYDDLINEDGTYIFYLINLERFEEEKEGNLDRLRKIASIIISKKFEKCGLRLVATFYDKYGKARKKPKQKYNRCLEK